LQFEKWRIIKMRILFMGTPDFAKVSLEAIYNAGHDIIGVVTNPDKPKGRGMKMIASPVKEFAIQKNIPIFQPIKVRNNTEFIDKIKALNPEIICVVAYGKILPKEILDIPEKGCINVHGSLLPKYRGAAPIQWAVLNGEKTTGITTMYMDIGMDTGDMILKKETSIGEDETTGELWDRLAILGGEALTETLAQIENGTVTRTKQSEDFSMAPMLDKSIAKIDWENQSATQIKNLVRGLNPIMGAYSIIGDKKYKFWKVDVLSFEEFAKTFDEIKSEIEAKSNGTVIEADCKKGLFIKAKDGIIKVLEIQGENAKRMPALDFLRGNKIN
jgi:methionyl-tRNA formyltransferase